MLAPLDGMFREALSYPMRKPKRLRGLLLGGGLVFLVFGFALPTALEPPLRYAGLLGVVPYVLLRGYYVRVVRTTIGRDRPTLPPFGRPRQLLRDGVASLFVTTVYLLPGVVVVGPLVYASALGTDVGTVYGELGLPTALVNAAVSVTGFLALVAAMSLIGALFAVPVGVARYAHTGRVRAAFEVRRVVGGALSEDYAVAWAISLLLQVLLFPFAYALRAVLVGFVLHFIVAAGVRYCYGQGIGDALGLDPLVPDPGPDDRRRASGDSRTAATGRAGEDPMRDDR